MLFMITQLNAHIIYQYVAETHALLITAKIQMVPTLIICITIGNLEGLCQGKITDPFAARLTNDWWTNL